jgi:hypothetical protein
MYQRDLRRIEFIVDPLDWYDSNSIPARQYHILAELSLIRNLPFFVVFLCLDRVAFANYIFDLKRMFYSTASSFES